MTIHLKTNRLSIRLISEKDIEEIHQLQSLEETTRYNTSKPPNTIAETSKRVQAWILEHSNLQIKQFTFAVELIENNQMIGLIGMVLGKEQYQNAEIWFQYFPQSWNKGYATECVRKVIDFGFEDLKLHRIEAGCAIDNMGSIQVLEKVGMTREAHTRKLLPLKSGWSDNYGYAILSTDERL